MAVVIVSDVQYRMSLAAIRDLGEAGHTVCALETGGGLGSRSRHVRERFPCGEGDIIGALERFCNELHEKYGELPVVFPAGRETYEALVRNAARAEGFCRFLVPEPQAYDLACDRGRLLCLAEGLEISVPRSYSPEGLSIFDFCRVISYPVVIKFRDSEHVNLPAAKRYAVARNSAEFLSIYPKFQEIQESPLVQEYVEGVGVGAGCLFDRDGEPASVITYRRVREYPVSGGPSSCCEVFPSEELYGAVCRILKSLKWTGFCMVEFKASPRGFMLMEINPRVWGAFPLTRIAKTGFSDAYVRLCLGGRVEPYVSNGPAVRMSFLLPDAAAAMSAVKSGDFGTFGGWLRDFFKPSVKDGVIELGDFRASVGYVKSAITRKKSTKEEERGEKS